MVKTSKSKSRRNSTRRVGGGGASLLSVPEHEEFSSYLASRRRSKTCSEVYINDERPVSEVTPLLLASRLHDLLLAPKDTGKRVSIIFCYLGMCTMLPWNFLVSITGFWNFKFRDVNMTNTAGTSNASNTLFFNTDKPTDLQLTFPSYLAIASCIPGAFTTIVHSAMGQRVSVETRMLWSLSMLLVSFISLLTLSIPDSDLWQAKFLHIVLMIVVLSNVGVSVMQGSMFGVSGRFPPTYIGCVMTGQALGGVIPASAAVALIAFDVKPQLLGPTCFAANVVLLILAIALTRWLGKNKFFLYYAEGKDQFTTIEVDHDAEIDRISYCEILKNSYPYLISGFLNYFITIGLFPGLTSLVESVSPVKSIWTTRFFKPVASVLLFNVCDLAGRTMATVFQWPGRSNGGKLCLLSISILRLGLIPLFMLCNAAPQTRHNLPILFDSDTIFCCLIITLAVSVGYIGNICLIHAPKTSTTPECQEATSLILTAAFVFGQASGSFLSYMIMQNL